MVKTKLQIKNAEDKIKKDGNIYTRFETSAGWMSCFDGELCNQLKEFQGQGAIEVDVETKGTFKNIKALISPDFDNTENATSPLQNNGNSESVDLNVSVQRQIVRMSAVKSASELDIPPTDLLKAAEEIEEWILRKD